MAYLSAKDALSLTAEASIHPSLTFFKELYDNGELAALNNVGYPDPDKSHFRSMDIWQSASSSKRFLGNRMAGPLPG